MRTRAAVAVRRRWSGVNSIGRSTRPGLMRARCSPNSSIVSHDLWPSINLFYVRFLLVGNLIFLPRCSGMCSAAPRVRAGRARSPEYHCLRNRHSVRRQANKFAAIVTHLVVSVGFFGAPKLAAVKLRQLQSPKRFMKGANIRTEKTNRCVRTGLGGGIRPLRRILYQFRARAISAEAGISGSFVRLVVAESFY